MMLRQTIAILGAALLLGLAAGSVPAGNKVKPAKGPQDCLGAPGAFVSAEAREMITPGTPPNSLGREPGRERGIGQTVSQSVRYSCGLGALPQADD